MGKATRLQNLKCRGDRRNQGKPGSPWCVTDSGSLPGCVDNDRARDGARYLAARQECPFCQWTAQRASKKSASVRSRGDPRHCGGRGPCGTRPSRQQRRDRAGRGVIVQVSLFVETKQLICGTTADRGQAACAGQPGRNGHARAAQAARARCAGGERQSTALADERRSPYRCLTLGASRGPGTLGAAALGLANGGSGRPCRRPTAGREASLARTTAPGGGKRGAVT